MNASLYALLCGVCQNKAIAKESGANFINIRASAIQSKWFGDTSKLVTAVFTLAWKIAPCIIFIGARWCLSM